MTTTRTLLPHLRWGKPLSFLGSYSTAILAALGVLSLAGAGAITIHQVQDQNEHAATVADLQQVIADHDASTRSAQSSARLLDTQIAEYGALLLEQDAAFASVEGFLK